MPILHSRVGKPRISLTRSPPSTSWEANIRGWFLPLRRPPRLCLFSALIVSLLPSSPAPSVNAYAAIERERDKREKPSHAIMPGGITTSSPPLSFLSGRRSCPLDRGGLPLSHVLFMHIPHPSSLLPLTHTSAKKRGKKLRTSPSLFPFLLSRPRRARE